MSAYVYLYPTPQEKIISSALAVGVHALLLLFLIFGIAWQMQSPPETSIVDLWANLPSSQPLPIPPPPEVKPQPMVEPPVESRPAPPPEIAKPDIALKQQTEEKREKKKNRQQEAVAQRLAQEQERAQQNVAAQQAAAQQSEIDKYKKAISDRIKRFVVLPPNMPGNPEADFRVRIFPGGEVMTAQLSKSSGVPAYDAAVERAIMKAQPLPLPPPTSPIFDQFRELNLTFMPQE
jgi:colicin import membrane protein